MTAVSDTNGYKHRKIMKEEILKIAKDLEQCTISEHQARTILLGMCVHDYGCNKKTKTGKCRKNCISKLYSL